MKRAFDFAISAIGLLLLAPLLGLIAAAIKLDSPGPVFFRQERIGRGGTPFRIVKLRTMAGERITPFGRFLRRHKLDELPQLFNVLLGEMSLVGPRPELPDYVARYSTRDRNLVLSVRPGITDLASIRYRNEDRWLARHSKRQRERTYLQKVLPRKLALCRYYVRHQSTRLDLGVILMTIRALVGGAVPEARLLSVAPRAARRAVRSRPRTGWRTTGLALCWIGLCAGSLSILASHPVFAFGVWPDAEPMAVVFLVAAALCSAGLGAMSLQSRLPLRNLGHPTVVVAAALALWSLLVAPLQSFPVLSILGPPQNSQGAIWYASFAAFIAAALILRADRLLFRSAVAVAAAAAVAAAIFNLWRVDWPDDWRPWLHWTTERTLLAFNEYQAYYALALLALALVALRRKQRSGWWLAGVGLISLLVSRNRAAMVAVLVFVPVALTLYVRRFDEFSVRLEARRQIFAAALTGCLLLIAAGSYATLRVADLRELAPTLRSRTILLQGLEPSLLDNSRALLVGHGWGRYADTFAANQPFAGIGLFDTGWAGMGRDFFHSHHGFAEALFAAGIPGLLLTLAMPAAVALGARARNRAIAAALALAWAVVDCFWFAIPVVLPVLALAFAGVAETSCRWRFAGRRALPAIGLATIATLLVAVAVSLFSYGQGMSRLAACLDPGNPQAAGCDALEIPADPRGAELGLATTMGEKLPALLRTGPTAPAWQVELVHRLLREADRRAATGRSLLLAMALADADAAIAFMPDAERFAPTEPNLFAAWTAAVREVVQRAPRRLDALAAYFNWLLLQKRHDDIEAMLELARRTDPRHPIVLWFSGIEMLQVNDATTRAEGLNLMRQALAGGLEHFMPVDATIKENLSRHSGGG
jgi:lipopolysaccharide/colanic/teichoic acid biosynthesis glycosyltransferase